MGSHAETYMIPLPCVFQLSKAKGEAGIIYFPCKPKAALGVVCGLKGAVQNGKGCKWPSDERPIKCKKHITPPNMYPSADLFPTSIQPWITLQTFLAPPLVLAFLTGIWLLGKIIRKLLFFGEWVPRE